MYWYFPTVKALLVKHCSGIKSMCGMWFITRFSLHVLQLIVSFQWCKTCPIDEKKQKKPAVSEEEGRSLTQICIRSEVWIYHSIYKTQDDWILTHTSLRRLTWCCSHVSVMTAATPGQTHTVEIYWNLNGKKRRKEINILRNIQPNINSMIATWKSLNAFLW